MKTVLQIFLLVTAACFISVATVVALGVLKARRAADKTDDDMATGMLASIVFWMIGGLFLFFAYLAS
jgi:hypothetical protein